MNTIEFEKLQEVKGILIPEGESFRDIIVTGPPGSGKTTLIEALGGWPEEGYLDLGERNWWRNRILTFRPREVHFGIPFWDHPKSHAVFDSEWLQQRTPVQFERICLPPPAGRLLGTDWRNRFLFYFQLPSAQSIFESRSERIRQGTHPVDSELTLDTVEAQHRVYSELADFFHRNGMKVMVREVFGGPPRQPLN